MVCEWEPRCWWNISLAFKNLYVFFFLPFILCEIMGLIFKWLSWDVIKGFETPTSLQHSNHLLQLHVWDRWGSRWPDWSITLILRCERWGDFGFGLTIPPRAKLLNQQQQALLFATLNTCIFLHCFMTII